MEETNLKKASEYHKEWVEELKKRLDTPEPCISTGIPIVDIKLGGGLLPGQLVAIGGLPSAGKTTFVNQISHHMAIEGHPVLIYNYEMSQTVLHSRMIARTNNIELNNLLYDMNITKEIVADAEKMPDGLENINYGEPSQALNSRILTDNVVEIIKNNNKTPIIVIDYLQKLPHLLGNFTPEYRKQIDENLLVLRTLTNYTKCVILLISSFNRNTEKFVNQDMGVFKESGNIEYDVDILLTMGIVRPTVVLTDKGYQDGETEWEVCTQNKLYEEKKKPQNIVMFNILKNRHGLSNDFKLKFEKYYQRFSSWDDSQVRDFATIKTTETEKQKKKNIKEASDGDKQWSQDVMTDAFLKMGSKN